MSPAERASAHNAAELLSNPRDRVRWLSSLGEDRADFIAALRGNAPAWFPAMDREKYVLVGRLLGSAVLAAL